MSELSTAVVLTPEELPGLRLKGLEIYQHVSKFTDVQGLHKADLDSVQGIKTPYCTWVDNDDELPPGTGELLHRLVAGMASKDLALGYTDSMVRVDGIDTVDAPGSYRHVMHYMRYTYLHHSVVMRTADAQALALQIPYGDYWTEYMFYAPLARQGAFYIPENGYVWNKKKTGTHVLKGIAVAQENSLKWYIRTFPLKLK